MFAYRWARDLGVFATVKNQYTGEWLVTFNGGRLQQHMPPALPYVPPPPSELLGTKTKDQKTYKKEAAGWEDMKRSLKKSGEPVTQKGGRHIGSIAKNSQISSKSRSATSTSGRGRVLSRRTPSATDSADTQTSLRRMTRNSQDGSTTRDLPVQSRGSATRTLRRGSGGSGVASAPTSATSPTMKRTLARKKVAAAKPTERPIPTIPKGWKWRGKGHPRYSRLDGVVLVEPENMPPEFPKFHPLIVPGSFWVVDRKKNEVLGCGTKIGEVWHGWSECSVCKNMNGQRCICPNGIMPSRSLEHFYILQRMREEGELPENTGQVNVMSPFYTKHGRYWYKAKETAPDVPVPARRPVRGSSAPKPRKSLTRHAKPAPAEFNLAETDAAAAKMAKTLTRKVNKSLKTPAKRTMRRKPQ